MAQHLIKVQFPLIGGLQSTLLQQKLSNISKGSCTTNTIQAIRCKNKIHWITATTKFCEPGVVNIYDTLYSALVAETRTIVKQLSPKSASPNSIIYAISLWMRQIYDKAPFIRLMILRYYPKPASVHLKALREWIRT